MSSRSPLRTVLGALLGALLATAIATSCSSREMSRADCNLVESFTESVCTRCDADGACIEMGSNRCIEQCSASHPCTYSDFPVCGPNGLCVAADCGGTGGGDAGPGQDTTSMPEDMTPDTMTAD